MSNKVIVNGVDVFEELEKQKKLLELYKELARIRLYLFGEIDAITGERLMEKDIEINKKIKEIRKQ